MKAYFYFTIILFVSCKTLKFERNPPFKVVEATYNYWEGGYSVKGTKVIISFKNTTNIVFSKLYFQNKETVIDLIEEKELKYIVANFTEKQKEDLILNKDSKSEFENNLLELNKYPFQLEENEAVLLYKEKGKNKYFKIRNIKKLDTDYYQ